MRRGDKEIKDMKEIEEIIREAKVCRLAFSVDNMPYIVPLSFGYEKGIFYFHSALVGKKIDMVKKNNRVFFEVDINTEVIPGPDACSYNMKYRSVMGRGRIQFIEDIRGKKKAFDIIMKHYTGRDDFIYPENILKDVIIMRLEVEEMTGKKSGY